MFIWVAVVLVFWVPITTENQSGILPMDLAFERTRLGFGNQPLLSPDGSWMVYGVQLPGESAGRSRPDAPTPSMAVGQRLKLISTRTGETRAIGPENANAWRPSWSPDGKLLAFYADAGGHPRLWVHSLTNGRARKVSDDQIKSKPWPGDEPRWHPDGRQVLVPLAPASKGPPTRTPRGGERPPVPSSPVIVTISDPDADEPALEQAFGRDAFFMRMNHVVLAMIDVESGARKVIMETDARPAAGFPRLSPSGRWISFLTVPRLVDPATQYVVHDLALVPVDGGTPEIIAKGLAFQIDGFFSRHYRWHPRRDELFVVDEGKLHRIRLEVNKPPERQRMIADWENLASWPLRFTRNGGELLVGLDPQLVEFDNIIPKRLALVPVNEEDKPRILSLPEGWRLQSVPTADPYTLRQPAEDSLIAFGGHTTRLEQGIIRWKGTRTEAEIVWQGPGRIGYNASGGKASQFVVSYQATGDSPDLYALEEGFSEKRRLTNVEPRLDAVAKTKVEIIQTTVPLYDGSLRKVQTAILLPENAKAGDRLPGVVVIYPGFDISKTASLFGGGEFATVPNLAFTSRGYAVLLTHIPLSPEGGAGEPVSEMVDALLPQVYHAANLGYVDVSRLAVLGQSYGGYAVAAVASRSNLFRAGIAISGLYDLIGYYGEEGRPGWYESAQGRMGTHPWGDRTRYSENSPYYHAEKIRTPLLLVHGDADQAIGEARKLFTALQRLERHAELAVYPGQGHGITIWKPGSSRDALTRMLAFLERHMK